MCNKVFYRLELYILALYVVRFISLVAITRIAGLIALPRGAREGDKPNGYCSIVGLNVKRYVVSQVPPGHPLGVLLGFA